MSSVGLNPLFASNNKDNNKQPHVSTNGIALEIIYNNHKDFTNIANSSMDDRNSTRRIGDSTETNDYKSSIIEKKIADFSSKLVYDSITPHFHIGITIKTFLIHMFLPFTPFLHFQKAYGFHIPELHIFHYILPSLLWIMVGCYFKSMSVFKDRNYPLQYCILFPVLTFATHRMMIALKYGCLSNKEYKKYLQATQKSDIFQQMKQTQLLSSWLHREDIVLDYELVCASIRCNVDIINTFIYIPSPKKSTIASIRHRHWIAFIKGNEYVLNNDNYHDIPEITDSDTPDYMKLRLYDVFKSITKRADKMVTCNDMMNWIASIFITVNVFLPIVQLLCTVYSTHGYQAHMSEVLSNRYSLLFIITSTLLNAVWYNVNIQFMKLAVIDVLRQWSALKVLHRMIRENDLTLDECYIDVPDYTNDSNIVTKTLKALMTDNLTDKDSGLASCSVEQKCLYHSIRAATIDKSSHSIKSILLPKISLNDSRNVLAWVNLTYCFNTFGLRFRNRLEIYIIILAICAIGLVGAAVGLVFSHSIDTRLSAFDSIFFRQALVTVTVMLFFIMTIVYVAERINYEATDARTTLNNHLKMILNTLTELDILMKSRDLTADERKVKEEKEVSKNIISECCHLLKQQQISRPFQIFFMPASTGISASVFSLISSFYLTLLTLYTQTVVSAAAAVQISTI